jgi:lactose/L-arabinose transport system substrate-binding protein
MKRSALWNTAALFVMAVMLTALISWGKKSAPAQAGAPDPDAPVTLTVWCWNPRFNIYAMNEAAKIYKREKPNVTIDVVEVPWLDIQQKLVTALSAKQTAGLPDITLIQDTAMQKNLITYPNAFLPVEGKVDLSKFARFKADFGIVNGKHYSVPFDNGATATFLRRDLVEQAGLKVEDFNNITWDRFIELGKIIKEKAGIPLISSSSVEFTIIFTMLQSAGSWFFKDDGSLYLRGNPVLKRSLEIVNEMIKMGIYLVVPDNNAYVATLNNGNVVSTVNGCWIISSITAEQSQSGKWAVVSTPRLSEFSDAVNYSNQGGSSWTVMSHSKNPDTAMDFLNKTFAGSLELYETILPSSGAIATWLPAAETPIYGQPNEFFGGQKIYENIMEYASKVPMVKYGVFNYEARDAASRALNDILQGKSVDEAIETAHKNVEFLIAQ